VGTIVVAAWSAPFFLFGWTWSGIFPLLLTFLGLTAWAAFSVWHRRKDERDLTLAYYDEKWSEYVAKMHGPIETAT